MIEGRGVQTPLLGEEWEKGVDGRGFLSDKTSLTGGTIFHLHLAPTRRGVWSKMTKTPGNGSRDFMWTDIVPFKDFRECGSYTLPEDFLRFKNIIPFRQTNGAYNGGHARKMARGALRGL